MRYRFMRATVRTSRMGARAHGAACPIGLPTGSPLSGRRRRGARQPAAASVRESTPSLTRMFDTWCSAVLRLMYSVAAICGFVNPAATSLSTSSSRSLSPDGSAGAAATARRAGTRTPRARSPRRRSARPSAPRRVARTWPAPPAATPCRRCRRARWPPRTGSPCRRNAGRRARCHRRSSWRTARRRPAARVESRPARASHTPSSPMAMPCRHRRPARSTSSSSGTCGVERALEPAGLGREPPRPATAAAGDRSRGRSRAPRRAAARRRRRPAGPAASRAC